jgi:hypothetical protein
LKNAVFWDVAPCRYCVNRRFRGTHRLHLQGIRNPRARNQRESAATCSRWFLARGFLIPWRWRRYVFPKRRLTISTQRHIPEDGNFHSHRHENLKSYIFILLVLYHPHLGFHNGLFISCSYTFTPCVLHTHTSLPLIWSSNVWETVLYRAISSVLYYVLSLRVRYISFSVSCSQRLHKYFFS